MPVPDFLICETDMREFHTGAAIIRAEFERNNRFSTKCSRIASEPGKLHQLIANQLQKSAVMGMALVLKMRFEEKRNIDLSFHQDGARFGKPLIELLRPRTIDDVGWHFQRALNRELMRAR